MADGVAITAGSGTTVATDDCGAAGHTQLIKFAISANGDATLVPADATNGIYVNVKGVGVGATDLGKAEDAAHTSGDVGVLMLAVRNDANAPKTSTDGDYGAPSVDAAGNANVLVRRGTARVSVQSGGLTTATTAYTAGDQVGSQFTVAGCARASGGTGYITGVALVDANDVIGAYDVVFFDTSVTPASDNAAFAISDADALRVVGVVQLGGAFDIGNNRVGQVQNLAIPYACNATSLFALLICRVGHTFFAAATNLQLIVYVEPD